MTGTAHRWSKIFTPLFNKDTFIVSDAGRRFGMTWTQIPPMPKVVCENCGLQSTANTLETELKYPTCEQWADFAAIKEIIE